MYFNLLIEVFFLLDIICNFLTEYKDPETYEKIRNLSLIAKRYIMSGWFFLDVIAIIPFNYINNGNNTMFIKLIRLLRLPRLAKLIDITRFN